jgi:DNA-binding HxlR family transcriptional regulator
VEYQLTDLGQSLRAVLCSAWLWANNRSEADSERLRMIARDLDLTR